MECRTEACRLTSGAIADRSDRRGGPRLQLASRLSVSSRALPRETLGYQFQFIDSRFSGVMDHERTSRACMYLMIVMSFGTLAFA